MHHKTTLTFAAVFFFHFGFSQEEKPIKGKIIIKDAIPNNIVILNLVNEKESTSNVKGEFTIVAKPEDVLVFHAPNLDTQRKILETKDYDSGFFIIEMTSKVEELDEVEIRNDINAVSLGILSKPAKKYTPAERRLKTAGEFKPIHLLQILGGSMPFDPVLNAISGRTKKLRKEVKVERREILLKKIDDRFDNDFFISEMKIPRDNVGDFKQYLIDDEQFRNVFESKNEIMVLFVMSKLSASYLNLEDEKE